MREKLKPCPFCGRTARITDIRPLSPKEFEFTGLIVEVKCSKCFARVSGFLQSSRNNNYFDMVIRATKKWNRRAGEGK